MAIIIDRQRKLNNVGEIRLGDVKGEKMPGRPLYKFRLSTANKDLIEQAAQVFGGTPTYNKDLAKWDLITDRTQLKAYISLLPRDPNNPDGDLQSVVQHYYRRDGRRWTHRCDGVTCDMWTKPAQDKKSILVQKPCQCDPDKRICKMNTLLIVGLTEIPVSGVWKLSTGSTTFDAEIQGFIASMQSMGLNDMPVVLTYDKITKAAAPGEKADNFPVVRVDVDQNPVSLPELYGQIRAKALGQGPAGLGSRPTAPELPATETAVRPPLEEKEHSDNEEVQTAHFEEETPGAGQLVKGGTKAGLAAAIAIGGTEKDYNDLIEVTGPAKAHTAIQMAGSAGLTWDGMMATNGWVA